MGGSSLTGEMGGMSSDKDAVWHGVVRLLDVLA